MACSFLDNQRDVVENRICTLELLERGNADARGHEVAIFAAEQHRERALTVRGGFFFRRLADVLNLGIDGSNRTDVRKHAAGSLILPALDQETRRLRQAQHAEEQDDGRHGSEAETSRKKKHTRNVSERASLVVCILFSGFRHGFCCAFALCVK